MASPNSSRRFTLSVLDRLCCTTEDFRTAEDLSSCNWDTYLHNLLRDINDLLNTRATLQAQYLQSLPNVARSIIAFGLPEVSRTTVGDERGIDEISMALTEVIRRFEPRLSRPRVTSSTSVGTGVVLFRLEADIMAEPAPIKLVFDTTFNADAGNYRVEGHLDEK